MAAEKYGQPLILQLGVQAIRASGEPLAVATLAAARIARVPVAVHLDHCPDIGLIEACFVWGFLSALADGSHRPFAENIAFTKRAVELAARYGGTIESELGYLAGTEDGLSASACCRVRGLRYPLYLPGITSYCWLCRHQRLNIEKEFVGTTLVVSLETETNDARAHNGFPGGVRLRTRGTAWCGG